MSVDSHYTDEPRREPELTEAEVEGAYEIASDFIDELLTMIPCSPSVMPIGEMKGMLAERLTEWKEGWLPAAGKKGV